LDKTKQLLLFSTGLTWVPQAEIMY